MSRGTVRAKRGRGQKGLALITFALALTLIVPLVGLGVDTAMLYVTKERLNTAVQLAVRAARKSATNPEAAAARTFRANFPPGFLGCSEPARLFYKEGRLQVTVEAPTFFMRMFRRNSVSVESSASSAI